MLTTLHMAAHVYRVVFANPLAIVRIPGKPLVMYVAILLAANIGVAFAFLPPGPEQIAGTAVSWLGPVFLASRLLIWMTALWVAARAALRWHHLVMTPEPSGEAGNQPSEQRRAYLWKLALLLCPGILASIVIGGGLNAMLSPTITEQPLFRFALTTVTGNIVTLLIFGLILGRVGLILPAVASGRPIDFMEAWDRSRPFGRWHVGLVILVNLPIQALDAATPLLSIWLLPLLAETFGVGFLSPLGSIVGWLIDVAILCLTIAVSAVALSFNYQGAFGAPSGRPGQAVSDATG